jgi:hypothetical protein
MAVTACAAVLSSIITFIAIFAGNLKRKGRDGQRLDYVEKNMTNLPCKENTKILEENAQRLKHVEEKLDNLHCEDHIKIEEQNSQRLKHIEEKLNDLPCKEHTKELFNLQIRYSEKFNKLHTDIAELKVSVNVLQGIVESTIKKSPLQLSEIGLKIYKDVDGEQFLNQYADMFIEKIEEIKPKTAYDLEQTALYILNELKNNDIFIPIKNILYNYPAVETTIKGVKKPLNIGDICFILHVPLRDRYLELHPELLPENYSLPAKENQG